MMIGVLAVPGRVRSNRQTSRPPSTGKLRSRMMRSGVCSLASLRAWSPLAATSTMASPERSSVCLTRPAMSFSSSTTSTRILSVAAGALSPHPVMFHGRRLIHGLNGSGRRFPANDEAVNSGLPIAEIGALHACCAGRNARIMTAAYAFHPRKKRMKRIVFALLAMRCSPRRPGPSLKPAPSSAPSRIRPAPSCPAPRSR